MSFDIDLPDLRVRPGSKVRLKSIDTDSTGSYESKETAQKHPKKGVEELRRMQEMLYAHGFRKAQDIANAAPEMLTQFPGFTMDMIPELQKRAREQAIVDAEKEMRLEQEREAARIAEARRHPDTLTHEERMARVRGVGEKTIEQLKTAGYPTVEAIHGEADMMRLAESSGLGIKKARQIKHAVGVYLEEEAKLRAQLDAEKAKAAEGAGP